MRKRIEYSYTDENGRDVVREWHGDRQRAIDAAARRLSAKQTKRGWIYEATETDEAWLVTSAEMAKAGAAILDGHFDYSLWCTGSGRRLSDRTRRKYFGGEK